MGELTDRVKRMIESLQISSASPGHINEVLQIDPSIDLDDLVGTEEDKAKEQIEVKNTIDKVKSFDKGQVGEIQRLSSQHFGNIRSFASDPASFIMGAFFKKFARGAGIIALGLLIFEAVKWVISEMLKPGRLLDRRWKRDIRSEIIAFRRREDQQKIKQGFSNIIITSAPRLRSGQDQMVNTFDMAAGREFFPENLGMDTMLMEASGLSTSKNKGRRFG